MAAIADAAHVSKTTRRGAPTVTLFRQQTATSFAEGSHLPPRFFNGREVGHPPSEARFWAGSLCKKAQEINVVDVPIVWGKFALSSGHQERFDTP
jgi:hypothetical protein